MDPIDEYFYRMNRAEIDELLQEVRKAPEELREKLIQARLRDASLEDLIQALAEHAGMSQEEYENQMLKKRSFKELREHEEKLKKMKWAEAKERHERQLEKAKELLAKSK